MAQDGFQKGTLKEVDPARGTITITTDGEDRDFVVVEGTWIAADAGRPAEGGLKHEDFRAGARLMFMAVPKDGKAVLTKLRLLDTTVYQPAPRVDMTGVKPLGDMGPGETYKGFEGGLYPGGKKERPADHEAAGLALARQVRPLDRDGKPSDGGKVVLMSVGMSNTMQAFAGFMRAARGDEEINPEVVLVNGAIGSMTARVIQAEDGSRMLPDGTLVRYWDGVDKLLGVAGVSRAQVQAAWIKQADAGPRQGFPGHARALQAELANIVRLLHDRFPNLKLVYLSSRSYAGWAKVRLNPEPYSYESGFAVKWLIEQQLKGDPELNYDPSRGTVRAPWLSWGPQLWANGTTSRSDGFRYEESDFAENDGTHESPRGQEKIGRLMLQFFKTDPTARIWFVRGSADP
jgi:hypothetical protein